MSSDYEQRILDRTFDANASLWGALVTANSILAGVGAALAAVMPKAPVAIWIILVLAAALSLWLLLLNFKATRDQYEGIGQQLGGLKQPSSRDVPSAGEMHRKLKRREAGATGLLFFELLLILGGVVWSSCAR